jgi:hypothetical protein
MSGDSEALFLLDTNIVLYFLGGRLASLQRQQIF